MKQRWLVTGSSKGLGRALVHAALESGHHVVATARDTDGFADLSLKYGDRVMILRLDVTNADEVSATVERAVDQFGGLDVVVNNAGYGTINSIEDATLADIRNEIETNLFGTIMVAKAVIPVFREQRSGHFINFSSVGGRLGAPGRGAYSASKWGVEGFSEVLAGEMALFGVKVTIIEPGGFRTDFAGASTTLNFGRPEYDQVVGAAARTQRAYDGRQPGDPQKAAQAILQVARANAPPLRLALGSDAVKAIRAASQRRQIELDGWEELSLSTDFEQVRTPQKTN
ncbi:oxidoreductase [Rhizobium sp. Root708]|uniref:oxidoreductase n=1 Tax=Rhizobium sp. Root708 TaxID=1736592 RepID=UPI0006FB5548|nr:oxidoreductase [Rhizobium sp. Root708]KRB51349.1 oxidoreductase [Rhizobium sp. Root708]